MALTSSGIGSGLDIDSLVTQLVRAEGAAPSSRLNKREATYQANLSAIGQLKSVLSEFKTSLESLSDANELVPRTAKSSDSDLFTVSAGETAVAGTYDIEVLSLAQAAKVRSGNFTDADTEKVGTGTLDISLGADTFQLILDSNNNTLEGIRDAINAASDNPGITASIINVDAGSQLVLNSNKIGVANTITVAATDNDALDGLDLTRLDSVNLTDAQVAQDASFKLDGQLVTKGSNSFSDVISGVTINLKKESAGVIESLEVSLNKDLVALKVKGFVDSYNALTDELKGLSSYNPETKDAGPLQGDPVLRGVQSALRNVLGDTIDDLAYGNVVTLGIRTDESGHYKIDSEQLESIIDADFTVISKLFSGEGGLASKLDSVLDSYLSSTGSIETRTESIKNGIKDVEGDRKTLSLRIEAIEKRYRAKFSAMDLLLGQLQNTSTYLAQQLKGLPGVVRKT